MARLLPRTKSRGWVCLSERGDLPKLAGLLKCECRRHVLGPIGELLRLNIQIYLRAGSFGQEHHDELFLLLNCGGGNVVDVPSNR